MREGTPPAESCMMDAQGSVCGARERGGESSAEQEPRSVNSRRRLREQRSQAVHRVPADARTLTATHYFGPLSFIQNPHPSSFLVFVQIPSIQSRI